MTNDCDSVCAGVNFTGKSGCCCVKTVASETRDLLLCWSTLSAQIYELAKVVR